MLTNRPQSSRKRQQAQAVTEFIIAWPIILLAICFVVQLFWLWWAQQSRLRGNAPGGPEGPEKIMQS